MHFEVSELFIFFSVTAFMGWILESAYRSVMDRQWVNAGFLFGPFIPIYGVGAMTIAGLALVLKEAPWYLCWPILIISPTILEYSSSLLLERAFGLRLWDYGEKRFNLHGRVCVFTSGIWAFLAVIAALIINPFLLNGIARVNLTNRYFYFGALMMYFIIDAMSSILSIVEFKKFIKDLKRIVLEGIVFVPSFDLGVGRMPAELRKIIKPLKAHPHLASSLKPMLHGIPEPIVKNLVKTVGTRHFR